MESGVFDMKQAAELSGRKRKKLFLKLKSQMEFYFGDSNLVKDKFLYNLIKEDKDGYVDLEIFKTFNKIKNLTEDVSLIAASLSKSDFLSLNADKSRVKRTTPIDLSKDFDACTLYVEGLPPHADLKWVKDVFEHFGTVDYINIPRFNISQKIKGFAFIEFSSPESVCKACQFYKNSPEFENESPSKKETEKKSKLSAKETSDNLKSNDKTRNKRKLEISNSESKKACKKQKTEKISSITNSKEKDLDLLSNMKEDVKEKEHQESSKETVEEELDGSKKKRKHSKKHRHERPTLRVMSKSEWKGYRNKYLDLQRTTMSYLKKQILLESHEIREQENNVKLEPLPKKDLKFQPGVILKLKPPKPVENPTDIKEQIKASTIVAYIDAQPGYDEVFIRCHVAEDASAIIQDKKLNHLGELSLLLDLDEEEYWKKIQSDRDTKLNNPVTKKRRGRDKLISKAAKLVEQRNKHIYFDE